MKRHKTDVSKLPWTPFEEGFFPEEFHQRAEALGLVHDRVFVNSRYQVCTREITTDNGKHTITHLSIKRRDKYPIRDWRDLQRIKNELCGPEREGFEVFPAESRLTDTANQYDMWVLPEGERIGVGWDERLVSEGTVGKARQRDFEDKPFDLLRAEDLQRLEDARTFPNVTPEEKELATQLSRLAVMIRYGIQEQTGELMLVVTAKLGLLYKNGKL